MGKAENIVLLRNKNGKTIYQRIKTFLDEKKNDSAKTSTAYEQDIRDFFRAVVKKEIEQLTEQDLTSFDNDDVTAYKNALVDAGYAPTSVNRKLSSIRSLYHKLSASLDIKKEVLIVSKVKGDPHKYGVLSWEETREMIQRVKEHENGFQKSLIIEMAARTGFRISSVLSIKWEDFRYDEKEDLWIVRTVGKGQKVDEKPLLPEFYNRLQDLCRNDDGYVFSLTDKTCRRAIERLCGEMGINPRRNIKFHSIKKMGVNYILDKTGDIRLAQQYANHSNAATTLNSYTEPSKNFAQMPSLTMGEEINLDFLDEMPKEQIIALLKECGLPTQRIIASTAKKMSLGNNQQ